jgi:uridine kinase
MKNMKPSERTRKLLAMHCQAYPQLKIQDLLKFLHQSSFGCEHLVSSYEIAKEYIVKEQSTVCHGGEQSIDPLDGAYSRVPLSYLNAGLGADTLAKLFVASSKKEKNGMNALLSKIEIARELITEGNLPFSSEEFENEVALWQENGFQAIHHSEKFRDEYHPYYRVISNEYIPFLPLLTRIDQQLIKGQTIVAIEGGSASGKTTLSMMLESIYDCTVFHMDDFFLQMSQRTPDRFRQIGGNIDWERFLCEVLQPLSQKAPVKYRKFDCSTMTLQELQEVVPKKLVIVEGAYSMHPEFDEYYNVSVLLDISPVLQRERILRRTPGALAQRFFNEWIPLEHQYFEKTRIKNRCNIVIDIS